MRTPGWGKGRVATRPTVTPTDDDDDGRRSLGAHLLAHAVEDVRQEERMQLLVGVVDAKLLEAVDTQRFEAEDIEQPHATPTAVAAAAAAASSFLDSAAGWACGAPAAVPHRQQQLVELVHSVREEARVERLGKSIAGLRRAVSRQRDGDVISPD